MVISMFALLDLPKIETKANEKVNSNDLAEEAWSKL